MAKSIDEKTWVVRCTAQFLREEFTDKGVTKVPLEEAVSTIKWRHSSRELTQGEILEVLLALSEARKQPGGIAKIFSVTDFPPISLTV